HRLISARNLAIEEIRDSGDEKSDESNGVRVTPGRTQGNDEENGQDKPAKSKTIRPIHAGAAIPCSSAIADAFWKTGVFQIGTRFFNSSTIHWPAAKAAPRWTALTCRKSEVSPLGT